MAFLKISGIQVQEDGVVILDDISFEIPEGRKLVIAGETGSGKSTLLQTISGLVQPSKGQVIFEESIVEGPHDKLVPGHPDIAYLSQHFELPQFLRVEQILKYANTLSEEEAQQLYTICRISHLAKRRTNQLSGGEKQRIALARLLSTWPSLLLLDEPFSNLDLGHKNTLKTVLRDISEELGITLILISHDPLDTLSWAEEILVMQQGKLIQQGTPQQVYKHPVNAYAAALFGKYNLIPAATAKPLFGLDNNSKNHLLLRPESIKLVPVSSGKIKGHITAIHYFGSYFELDVRIADISLNVRVVSTDLSVGDAVGVEIGDVWWV